MKIRVAEISDQPAWDEYVLHHPNGLAYHQFAWKKAVEVSYGLKGHYLIAEQGNSLCGVLPLVDFKTPTRRYSMVSLPYCDVGGVLADNSEIAKSLTEAALARNKEFGWSGVELRYAARTAKQKATYKVRLILELPSSSEALLASFNSKLRSQIKKPTKDGLTTKLGGPELLKDLYFVLSQNMKALGSPIHSLKWFHAVMMAYEERVRIGVVYTPDGCPVAAGVILLHAKTVSVPWASSLRRLNHLNGNMLLYWSFLSFASDNSYEIFDFGRSSLGCGTYNFKLQWGSKPEPLSWVKYGSDGNILDHGHEPANLRKLAAECWSRMPLKLCNYLGAHVRPYISL